MFRNNSILILICTASTRNLVRSFEFAVLTKYYPFQFCQDQFLFNYLEFMKTDLFEPAVKVFLLYSYNYGHINIFFYFSICIICH